MQIEAGREEIVALLMDHDNFKQLSEVMIESGLVQDAPEDKTRRRLVVETCIVFFCFKVVMVEDIEQFPDGRILASMVPEESDFKYGRTEWLIEPLGPAGVKSTIVSIFSRISGSPRDRPVFIKRKMIKEAQISILKMESLAAEGPAGEET